MTTQTSAARQVAEILARRVERRAALLVGLLRRRHDVDSYDETMGDGPYLLIERSARTGHLFLTRHDSPGEASRYWGNDYDYAAEFVPLSLVDLATGLRYEPQVGVRFAALARNCTTTGLRRRAA